MREIPSTKASGRCRKEDGRERKISYNRLVVVVESPTPFAYSMERFSRAIDEIGGTVG